MIVWGLQKTQCRDGDEALTACTVKCLHASCACVGRLALQLIVFSIFSAAVNSLCVRIYMSVCGSWWLSEVSFYTFSSTLVLSRFIKNVRNESFHKSDIINFTSRSPTLWGNAEQRGILRALNTNVTLMLQSWAHVLSSPTFHTISHFLSLPLHS